MKRILGLELINLKHENSCCQTLSQRRQELETWIGELQHIERFGSPLNPESHISTWFLDYFSNPLSEYDLMLAEFDEYEEILQMAAKLTSPAH